MALEVLTADWPAPAGVHGLTTLRSGGTSRGPFHSLNLADHVGDEPSVVAENRRRLSAALALPSEPSWLRQVHGKEVCTAHTEGTIIEADASYTSSASVVCAVLTADCLPLLLCNDKGSEVAAVHAGWRGLLGGVIDSAVAKMESPRAELLVWMGPAIGAESYEVDGEMRDAFIAQDAAAKSAFRPSPAGRWLADLYQLAQQRLARLGVERVYGGGLCTYRDTKRYFSFRRDGKCGRMATMVWIGHHRG